MPENDALKLLVDLSREFGSDPRYVIAGGGNSSIKSAGVMYVKGSGSRMGSITADGFVAMDLNSMTAIWDKNYSTDTERREEEVLADLLAARKAGEEQKRPSVEALLHALFPSRIVMHTHPALVNGITCGVAGEKKVAELFGDKAIWIPLVEPGYILAKVVRDAMAKAGSFRNIVFLQNHGVFIAAETPEEIRALYREIFAAIEANLQFIPRTEIVAADYRLKDSVAEAFSPLIGEQPAVLPFMNTILEPFLQSQEAFSILEHPLTPDHMVYAGFLPLFIERITDLPEKLAAYFTTNKELPKIVALKKGCCYACAKNEKATLDASELFIDAATVIEYSRSFGGSLPMTEPLVSFIRNWEVEKYRQNKA